MAGIIGTLRRSEQMLFSASYLEINLALVTTDHEAAEYTTLDRIRRLEEVRVAVAADMYFAERVRDRLPDVEVVTLAREQDFFQQPGVADALLTGAEIGSAGTLMYPGYRVVNPSPRRERRRSTSRRRRRYMRNPACPG